MDKEYRICKRCIMDTSDPDIVFDEDGFCNHCTGALKKLKEYPFNLSNVEKEKELCRIVNEIKEDGKDKLYDCIVGVSGGVDSSYVLHMAKEYGLSPLAVHVDNEWDTKLSVDNVENVTKKLGVPLVVIHVNWDEFKDMQLSFLKSSTPDLEIVTDHALKAALYNIASRHKVRYILSGLNTVTESISVVKWSHGHYDWRYIKLMQKRFGTVKVKHYPHLGIWNLISYQLLGRMKVVKILDYLPSYDKKEVVALLKDRYGWQSYITKHAESVYTFFVQSYVLPVKFGFDKRRMHLSNLIVAGQISRVDALRELDKSLFSDGELEKLKQDVCDKLGIDIGVLFGFMHLSNRSYFDYPSYESHLFYRLLRNIYKKVKKQ